MIRRANRPSKREVMRRNRRKQEAAVAALAAERAWAEERTRYLDERTESYEDTRDWLEDTRERARAEVKREPEPPMWRVLLAMAAGIPMWVRRAINRRRYA